MHNLRDALNRPIRDLRLSVTDRCNFRCNFCMPADRKYEFSPKHELLNFEEMARIARILTQLGVNKIRLTGGEPLLRRGIDKLVHMLATLPVTDLAMTTNGVFLAEKAALLKQAGLKRVTVSIHSLDPVTIRKINCRPVAISRILKGVEHARHLGLHPIKINTAVIRGLNDSHLLELARYCKERNYILRFIEYMDVGTVNAWNMEKVVCAREIFEIIDSQMPLQEMEKNHYGEVATRFRYRDSNVELGIISAVTQPFCRECSRIRLSSSGSIYTCLFAVAGHDIKTPLRQGATDGQLLNFIRDIWQQRRDHYCEQRAVNLDKRPVANSKIEMFRIGG